MTANQINAAKVAEDARHNRMQELIGAYQNVTNREHYQKSDDYTAEHYKTSDESGRISANASAMNAEASLMNAGTNRKKYQMEYDIEYGWTGDTAYPSGMPLSAQRKNFELQRDIELYPITKEQAEVDVAKGKASATKDLSTAMSNVFNALFGKSGLTGALSTIITE